MAVFWPNDRDKALIQWVLDEVRAMPRGKPTSDSGIRGFQPTASSYVAKVEGGIGPVSNQNIPGSSLCDIYEIVQQGDELFDMRIQRKGTQVRVFNISDSAIDDGFVVVTQLKGGKWVALAGGTSSTPSADFLFVEGFLTEDLEPPQYATDPPTGVDIYVYERRLEFAFPEPLTPVMVAGTGGQPEQKILTCWTSDPYLSAPAGSYCQATQVQGLEHDYYVITYLSCDSALPPGTGTGS